MFAKRLVNRYLFLCLALLCVAFDANAGSGSKYYAALNAAVSASGGGSVYAGTSSDDSNASYSSSSTASGNSSTSGASIDFYAHAKAADGYAFNGWSSTEGGTIVSTENPYKVSVSATNTSSSSPSTATLYANFLKLSTEAFDVKFQPADNGGYTVTVGSETTTVSSSVVTKSQSGLLAATLTAKPAAGYKLYGWYTMSGGIKTYVSYASTYSATFTSETSIYAEFIDAQTPLFVVGTGTTLYKGLQAALDAVGSTTAQIILVDNGTVSAGNYTIPSNVTLLIPFNDAHTCYTTTPAQIANTKPASRSCYKKLTLADGANIVVKGKVSVSAQQCQYSTQYCGVMYNSYGQIEMEEGSSMTLKSGAAFYAWGYVTGEGNLYAESGSNVYESFQIGDFRGGTCSSGMAGNKSKVFPFNQYYVQNIEAPITFYYGAKEHLYSFVYTSFGSTNTGDILFIATTSDSNGLFRLSSGASITKKYNPALDRQEYTLNGEAAISSISAKVYVTISSTDYVLPLTNNLSLTLAKGSRATTNEDIALFADADITVEEGAEMIIASGKSLYVYDVDDWGTFAYTSAVIVNVPYSPTKSFTRTKTNMKDAMIDVQGTLTINGHLYTTENMANICCTKGRGKIVFAGGAGTETVTYQVIDTSPTYAEIAITNAQLKNADGSYTSTEGCAAGATYYYCDGIWSTNPYPRGDVSHSGNVSIKDLSGLVKILRRQAEADTYGTADADGNGEVNFEDIEAVVNKILEK